VALSQARILYQNHSGDFPQVILIIPSHVPNTGQKRRIWTTACRLSQSDPELLSSCVVLFLATTDWRSCYFSML
jgi:hypothetical protein